MLIAATTCLALNVFFEARYESTEGQLAVAQVTLNRVKDKRYPNTICKVVWDKKQFSWTHDGVHDDPSRMSYLDRKAWEAIQKLSSEVLEGTLELDSITSTHYHSIRVKPFWVKHYEYDGKVGDHLFYTNETPYR